MEAIRSEFKRLEAEHFTLKFTYPTADQRQQLRLVHRDIAESVQLRLDNWRQELTDLAAGLRSGDILLGDLDVEVIAELRDLLGS